MKVIRNCALSVKLVFKYAPWNAFLYMVGYFVPGSFSGIQILLVQNIVDSGMAYVNSVNSVTGEAAGALESIIVNGGVLVALLFFWVVLQRMGSYESRVIETKLTRYMASDIMEKLQKLDYAAFESKETQEVLQRISQSPWQNISLCFNRTMLTLQMVWSVFVVLGVYMTISIWIGIGLFLIAVPMIALNFSSTRHFHNVLWGMTAEGRKMKDLKQLIRSKDAMYEMKVFGSQALIAGKWKETSSRVEAEMKKGGVKVIALEGIGKFLNMIYYVFIIMTLAYSLVYGVVTLGQFVAAIGSIGSLTGKVNAAAWQASDAMRFALDMEFYREFQALPEGRNTRNVDQLSHYDIAFENVSFSYPGTDREVLSHVTFRIKEGERVAFVGENGAGKSTMIKLLCGLYKPDGGRVLIGGVDVRELSRELRKKLLSVVFQDFQGYELTLGENVALGNIEKLGEDAQIREALKLAGGESLYTTEERGLKRNLGHLTEDGKDLSKGQWQRVAIARAFLADAAFCVLDEPTASLDPIAESHMYENFARIFHKNGTIMISHRLASAKMADRIMVLDGGRIVQNGSHEQLMQEEGLYRTMYLAQSSWYLDSAMDSESRMDVEHTVSEDYAAYEKGGK